MSELVIKKIIKKESFGKKENKKNGNDLSDKWQALIIVSL